jgi:hypothetical protein
MHLRELIRFDKYSNAEMPEGIKTIVRVKGIANADKVLTNCKNTVRNILQNIKLKETDSKWRNLIPQDIVRFLDLMSAEDFENDDLLFPLDSLISDFKDPDLREWEWYSSKLEEQGFQIIFKGVFSLRFIWIIHVQNIPYNNITAANDIHGNYKLIVYRDVTTYKEFQ